MGGMPGSPSAPCTDPGFHKPPPQLGVCSPADHYDRGFVYKIDTRTFKIRDAIQLGSLPKDLALAPDGRYLLVTNWCSYDVSVVDLATDRQVRRIKVGQYPRGVAITPDSRTAYITMLGGTRIATLDLRDFGVHYIPGVGGAPRDAILDPRGRYLYLTLSLGDGVVKLDLLRHRVVGRAHTGDDPRSMAIAPDGRSLYLVNYGSGTVSKVRTRDMHVLQTLKAGRHPVGITYDIESRQVWVSMYSRSIARLPRPLGHTRRQSLEEWTRPRRCGAGPDDRCGRDAGQGWPAPSSCGPRSARSQGAAGLVVATSSK